MIYPEHPFVNDIEDLSVDQLLDKINELNKKLSIAYRMMNPNVYVINQMMMMIETYQNKYNEKLRKNSQNDGFDDIIDIN